MNDTIIAAFISGICTILGGILGALITRSSLNTNIEKDNTKENNDKKLYNVIDYHTQEENKTQYFKRENAKYYINIRNSNLKFLLKIVLCIILFLIGINIYIIFGQLVPKIKKIDILVKENFYLDKKIDFLNEEIAQLKDQSGSLDFSEFRIQIIKDIDYTSELMSKQENVYNSQSLLNLQRQLIQLLYSFESGNYVDLNILIKKKKQLEVTLQSYL